ncbi:MAG: Polyketide cyclase / dehydrase family protein, partial [Microbacteriaceae bacterium]|nr:Polyketide cyclase / dehydrase family protein [Microbacteriaceae bacterium]
ITEQIPDDRIAWTSTRGEVDHAGVVTFPRLSDDSSRVAVQIDWQPEGFVERAGAALDIPDRAVEAELENFKRFIEAAGTEGGAWRGTLGD